MQTFPPESCIWTQHLRAGLLNMSPGASLHTQMCTLCAQQAKLHLQRISQQHRARPHMAQHKDPQQCRAGKELDSRVCSCPAIIHENFGAARSCISCALFSSLCRQTGEHLSKRRAERAMEQAGLCAQLGFVLSFGNTLGGSPAHLVVLFYQLFSQTQPFSCSVLGQCQGPHGGPSWPLCLGCSFLLYEFPYLCILRLFILAGVNFLDWSKDKVENPSPCLGRWFWAGVNQYPS